jgi:thiamine pyrophosphate-dependent acetolactate synthase large subunit-like protein
MGNELIDRVEFSRELLADAGDLLVVTGIGTPGRNVRTVADRDLNFILAGSMGAAAGVGLGLALARPDRRVAVITGDAELMMNVGTLATIAVQRPKNLSIVVIDNERFGATGSQRSHTSHGVDLAGIARSSGFSQVMLVRDAGATAEVRARLHKGDGPFFCLVKVAETRRTPGGAGTIRDGVLSKSDFQQALAALK